MFQYIFADGSEVLARKGLPPLTVEKEEQTHGELLKVKEIRDGNELRTGIHGTPWPVR